MKKTQRRILAAVAAAGVILAVAAIYFYTTLGSSAVVRKADLYVPTGATFQTLMDSLGGDGDKIRSIDTFTRYAKLAKVDQRVRPGHYLLKEGMSYREVVTMLSRGLQTPVRLTFNNIRTIDRLAGALGRQTEPDSLTYLSLLTDKATAEKYGFEPRTFIGMFIPNTYEVYWNTSPEALLDKMSKEYERFWNEERQSKLDALKMTRIEVSTLASIVYEETKMSDEMPKVAGVYINRLRIGMPLQADPTVKFAVGDPTLKRILNKHLAVESPYNTYIYRGLPPGAICMPSIKAIDAVLNYSTHNYIYFCASPDFSGYHRFATNLAGHNRNRDEYVAFLNRQGIR